MSTSEQARADAMADAETLVFVSAQCGYRGPLRTVEDLVMAGLSVLGNPDFTTVFADPDRLFAYAARSAFRAVPGLRG